MIYRRDLHDLLAPAATTVGVELWGCELISAGKYSMLRVYIDKPEGITLDDCEMASKQMSMVLDTTNPIKERYQLEVSSPGLARPLFLPKHYQQYIGCYIKITLFAQLGGKRKLRGTIATIENDELLLINDDKKFLVPLANITKAHTIY